MQLKIKKYSKYIPLIFLICVTLWLRLANLGYSDYQGDEIKALYKPEAGQNMVEFFLDQRKGPTQFVVTYLLKFIDPLYTNQILMRLPFAIASILAIFFFYKFVKQHFNEKIALYSSSLLSVNGIIVAFGRIVQYQSFVILFFILALYFFSLSLTEVKWRIAGLYYGMAAWGLSMLSHYDGIFIAPFVLYVLWEWHKIFPSRKHTVKLMHIFLSGTIVLLILGMFYIPFIFTLSQDTLAYWQDRLSGGEGKISSSIVTFKVYNPKLMFYVYSGLIGIYFIKLFTILAAKKVVFLQKFKEIYENEFLFKKSLIVLVWALGPWIFLELLTSVPGTHIYTYIVPVTILVAFGIFSIEDMNKKIFNNKYGTLLNIVGLTTAFVFMFYLTHKVFVDHSAEYPWEEEKFLGWTLNKPNPIFHLSMFGFPYHRSWEEVGYFIQSTENNGWYSTNERSSIARHYVPFSKDTDTAGHYVYIANPQSFTDVPNEEKAVYWMENYTPVKVFYNNGKPWTKVYYMPAGNLEIIKQIDPNSIDSIYGMPLNEIIN